MGIFVFVNNIHIQMVTSMKLEAVPGFALHPLPVRVPDTL